VLLPCGHVLAEQSAVKLARSRSRAFKCPYCEEEGRGGAVGRGEGVATWRDARTARLAVRPRRVGGRAGWPTGLASCPCRAAEVSSKCPALQAFPGEGCGVLCSCHASRAWLTVLRPRLRPTTRARPHGGSPRVAAQADVPRARLSFKGGNAGWRRADRTTAARRAVHSAWREPATEERPRGAARVAQKSTAGGLYSSNLRVACTLLHGVACFVFVGALLFLGWSGLKRAAMLFSALAS
jgi:hypothetical protein